jgi:PBSX family phage terminase large subunit
MRQAYHYPNGSEIVVGGLDKPSKVMSTEYDGIYVQEAIELFENDWESLTTRLRNGVMPFQQLIADTNPDSPTHWLNARCKAGKTGVIESRHEDNPVLWDARRGAWTEAGEKYIAKLDALSGARKERLRYGRWAQAEGAVYEEWDRAVHLIDPFEIPSNWRRIRSIDFGFTNPFSCSWWAIDNDGRMFLYRQIYRTQRLVEDHAERIVELSTGERYEATVADHDAEDRATLAKARLDPRTRALRAGIQTIPAYKLISPGIQAVQARLRPSGDGKPRLFVFDNALVDRDESLAERKLPTCTADEFEVYVWPKGQDGKAVKEVPVDLDNHGLDELRYAVAYVDRLGSPASGPARILPPRPSSQITMR